MPPRFVTCQLCMQQFSAASLPIHAPQCYSKQLGRWEQLPPRERGPRPQMPLTGPLDAAGALRRSGTRTGERAIGGTRGVREAREARPAVPVQAHAFAAPTSSPPPLNCAQCRKCGRSFAFDRVRYHESVCLGARAPRKKFDSAKQRLSGVDGEGGFGGFRGRPGYKPRTGGGASFKASFTGANVRKSNWREQHEAFISAIRAAKQADVEDRRHCAPRGARQPPVRGGGPPGARMPRQAYASSALRNPEVMRTDNVRRVAGNFANGGLRQRAAGAHPAFPPPPPPRAERSSAPTSMGRGPPQKYGIVNSNETSRGMLEAFGRV